MSPCYLLLDRPWQFDRDATHGGCSNHYSFLHKEFTICWNHYLHITIKAEVFATVKKKVAFYITPKPRIALLQEGENGDLLLQQWMLVSWMVLSKCVMLPSMELWLPNRLRPSTLISNLIFLQPSTNNLKNPHWPVVPYYAILLGTLLIPKQELRLLSSGKHAF